MQTTRSASLDTRNRHLRLHPDPSRILLTNSSFPSANPFMLSILGIYPPGGGIPRGHLKPNRSLPATSGAAHD
jgi:hypothetical protein